MGRCSGVNQDGTRCRRSKAGERYYFCQDHGRRNYNAGRNCNAGLDFCVGRRDPIFFDNAWLPSVRPPPPVWATPQWRSVSPPPPVPIAPQNPVPEPARMPEPAVTPTPGYPIPANTRAPDVEVRNGMRCFSYNAVFRATNGFSGDSVLGSGGYGKVHAGTLRTSLLGMAGLEQPTTKVAIKMLDAASLQGEDNFQAEVGSLTCLRHPNIVPLYGICHEHSGLVYPRLSSSVFDKLQTADSRSTLPWQARVKIAVDAAAGIEYCTLRASSTATSSPETFFWTKKELPI